MQQGKGQNKRTSKNLTDTDNSMGMTRGEGWLEEVEEGKGGINGDGKRHD